MSYRINYFTGEIEEEDIYLTEWVDDTSEQAPENGDEEAGSDPQTIKTGESKHGKV